MTKERQSVGRNGELMARYFLEKKGFKIVEMNLRLKTGEIDILAQDHDILVIVEVKTKSNDRFGLAQEEVDFAKQKKLKLLAGELSIQFPDRQLRIDVVAINFKENKPVLEYIQNAVEA